MAIRPEHRRLLLSNLLCAVEAFFAYLPSEMLDIATLARAQDLVLKAQSEVMLMKVSAGPASPQRRIRMRRRRGG